MLLATDLVGDIFAGLALIVAAISLLWQVLARRQDRKPSVRVSARPQYRAGQVELLVRASNQGRTKVAVEKATATFSSAQTTLPLVIEQSPAEEAVIEPDRKMDFSFELTTQGIVPAPGPVDAYVTLESGVVERADPVSIDAAAVEFALRSGPA